MNLRTLVSRHFQKTQILCWQNHWRLSVCRKIIKCQHHTFISECNSIHCKPQQNYFAEQKCFNFNNKHSPKIKWILSTSSGYIHTSCLLLKDNGEKFPDDDDDDASLTLAEHSDMYKDQYLHPCGGHHVVIIHPVLKESRRGNTTEVSSEEQLAESCSLIDALPDWTVIGKEIINIRQVDASNLFTKGIFDHVKSLVRQYRGKSAVFVNMGMLTGVQLAMLQDSWQVPVYDRYTIILLIFRLRSRTKEAKLQLALAEIPYYRSRLKGMHEGSLAQQKSGLHFAGGSGESWMEMRHRIIAEKEQVIRKKLSIIKSKRQLLRQERKKKELPLVAVVGYTNAGKTSLIKALTKSSSLEPWDQVFATLDVTCHAGYLGNHMKVVYIDTVGFISNIPTALIKSFSATLEDVANADVIVHVRDSSHPDTEAQKLTVLKTLDSLKLDRALMDSIIEVNNKIDLVPRFLKNIMENPLSVLTGEGLPQLIQSLEDSVIISTGRVNKLLKIPQAGSHLAWLYKEGTVIDCRSCDTDNESLLVNVVMTTASYDKFCARFRSKKIHQKR